MSEWAETTLGEVADINPESTPRSWRADRVIRYIDIASVSKDRGIATQSLDALPFGAAPGRARRVVRAHDVIVSTVRPNLRAFAQVPPTLDGEVASTGFAVVRARERRIRSGFIWCLVSSDSFAEAMVRRCTGSNYPAIRGEDAAQYVIPLPSLTEQRRIVDVMAAVDAQIEALASEAEGSRVAYWNATSLLWSEADGQEAEPRSIGEMMTLDINRMTLAHDEVYSIAGVLGSGQGMIDKGRFQGNETKYRAMNVLRTDQVVMRKLTAWEGPITVVPAAFDGFLASNEFPTFTLHSGVNPSWIRHVCRTQRLWDEMKNRVTGSVQRRKRLSPEQLLAVRLPVPSAGMQDRVAGALDALDRERDCTVLELATLRVFRSTLLTSLLNQDVEIPESYDAVLAAELEGVS